MLDAAIILNQKHIRATPARKKIVEFFLHNQTPVPIDNISNDVKIRSLHLDPVTIYRTVNLLSEKNILRQIDLHEGKFRYELASRDHHHHVICLKCGKIEDVDTCLGDQWKKQIEHITNFHIQTHSLEFFGLCSFCQ